MIKGCGLGHIKYIKKSKIRALGLGALGVS